MPPHEHRALLIQDIGELAGSLQQHLTDELLQPYVSSIASREHLLEWIIQDLIEEVYLQPVENHDYRLQPYRNILAEVKNRYYGNLSLMFRTYVLVPKLYGEQVIRVALSDTELRMRSEVPLQAVLSHQDLLIWYPK